MTTKFNARNSVGIRPKGSNTDIDFFPSPPIAYEKLLEAESFPDRIWEPACGDGVGSEVMKQHNKTVYSSDMYDHGYEHIDKVRSFFDFDCCPDSTDAIITNPPYNISKEFIEHALDISKKSAFLLRLQFLESIKRTSILDIRKPKLVMPFIRRIPRMHKFGYDGVKSSSSIAFAWFVWEYPYDQDTIIKRI